MKECLWLRLSTGFDGVSLHLQKNEDFHVSTVVSTQHEFVSERDLGEVSAEIAISQWFTATNSNNKPGTPDGTDLSEGPIWLENRAKHLKRKGKTWKGIGQSIIPV